MHDKAEDKKTDLNYTVPTQTWQTAAGTHAAQVHAEHLPGQTIHEATKQVSINLKGLTSFKVCSPREKSEN